MARSKRFIQFLISLSIIVSGCTSLHDNVSAGLGMKPEPAEPTFYLPKRDIVKVDRKGSLWPVEGSKNFLFSDRKAKEVGDIITVNVIEKTSASKSASTKSDRGSSADASVTTLFGIPLDLGITDFLGLGNSFSPGVKGEYASSFDGSGSTERSDDFTAKITVQVVGVFPNGNLTIEGYREVIVNHERQLLFLKGIIRPEDITPGNTIDSTYIADAEIEYSGKGIISDKQSPGWMVRVIDVAWPF